MSVNLKKQNPVGEVQIVNEICTYVKILTVTFRTTATYRTFGSIFFATTVVTSCALFNTRAITI